MSHARPAVSCRPLIVALCALLSLASAGTAVAGPKEDQRARDATRVLREIQAIPESGIPDRLLEDAKAIVVLPDTIKVALALGGRRGHGLVSVKSADGSWSRPSFVKITGGSVGFQAGVQSADVVLVFRNDRSLESIVNGKLTLGADAGVAAGPVGRNAAAATDGQLKAEIWSWSRARGLFAGIALDGAALTIDDAANEAVYGRDTTPRMIFEGRVPATASAAVVGFRDQLEEATDAARGGRPAARAAAPAASSTADRGGAQVQGLREPVNDDPRPAPFEPVNDNPAKVEALPDYP